MAVTTVGCDDLAWLDCPGDCPGGDVDALLDWIASPTASSSLSAQGDPFSDFWTATTTQAAAWKCSSPDQHQPSPAAAQQAGKAQVVPDSPWPFPAEPTTADISQPVSCVVGAQQGWLHPAAEHGAAAHMLFSRGSSLSIPPPEATAGPAGLSYTPQAAPLAQAAGSAPGPYLTMLQDPHSPPAVVPVWNPSMQHSQFYDPVRNPSMQHSQFYNPAAATSEMPFGATAVQQPWIDTAWTQAPPAAAAAFECSTGMYAGMHTPPYPASCTMAPFPPGCGVLGCLCMHAAAPGMDYCPPLGLSCSCMQSQYAIGGQPSQDYSCSGYSSGSATLLQLAPANSTSPMSGTAASSSAGAGTGSVAAVLAAAAPAEQHLMRIATLGRSGSGSALTAAGALHTPPALPAAAPVRTACPMGTKPSPLQAPSGQLHAGAKGSAQAASKVSAQMKPPAPRLAKPTTKVAARAGRARGGGEVDERLHALACMAGGNKMQQLSNTKSSLQATIQRVQDSNAQLRAKLSTLRGMVSTMAADNHQLQADNSELREQVQAVVRHLQQQGIPVPDLGY